VNPPIDPNMSEATARELDVHYEAECAGWRPHRQPMRIFDSAAILPFVEDDRPTLRDVSGPGDRGRRA
jgi:hypothetical protein